VLDLRRLRRLLHAHASLVASSAVSASSGGLSRLVPRRAGVRGSTRHRLSLSFFFLFFFIIFLFPCIYRFSFVFWVCSFSASVGSGFGFVCYFLGGLRV